MLVGAYMALFLFLYFSVLPSFLVIFMNESKHVFGSEKKPFYCSNSFDTKFIRVFISGKPHFLNQVGDIQYINVYENKKLSMTDRPTDRQTDRPTDGQSGL